MIISSVHASYFTEFPFFKTLDLFLRIFNRILGKYLYVASIFFWGGDQDGILLIDYLSKGQTVNTEYYSSLLVQLKDVLK